ncbi:MAG: radical SAM protein, partial [Oscillospiraceae bacterium]|nr:radical SAM protein [Oscillospiraceae bacterium]
DLVEMAAQTVPEMRIRLGSLEPRTVTEEFCRRLAPYRNLCPQFHLSLQSGSDATLKRMNRKYDTAHFMESVRLLRNHFENVAITTDLITGFPQETEEEFCETLAFIRAVGFADMHIFPYSIRPGTPAAGMEQIEKSVKEERAARAAAVAAEMHREYLLSCVGQRFEVLFEQEKNGHFLGHAPNYMPVSVEGTDLHNKVLAVEITGLHGDGLSGIIVEGANA